MSGSGGGRGSGGGSVPGPAGTASGRRYSWEGWDLRSGSRADVAAPAAFAGSGPADHRLGAHFELIAVAARGFRPPRFLSVTRLPPEESPDSPHPDPGTGGGPGGDHPGLRQTWSLEYRLLAETAPPIRPPHAVYLLGVDPPPDVTDEDLEAFNEFYTAVHLPEVAERRRALRAARYELLRELRPPHRGAPRFLAVYEVDEQAASDRRHKGPPYRAGPVVWQRHTTPWRLWYRLLVPGSPEGEAG